MSRAELIERLEKAEGGSRELDAEIALLSGWKVFSGDNWIGPGGDIAVPAYTTDINAALELVEAKLPGILSRIEGNENYGAAALYRDRFHESCRIGVAVAKTRPLALVVALFKAIEGEDQD